MSMYKETRGPNWGAALAAIGGGFSDYAETKRREMAMKMLREQQVADRDLVREQQLADQQAMYDRQDTLNTQQSGPVLPAYQKPSNAFYGLAPSAAVGYASGLQFPEPAPQTPVQYYGGLQMPSDLVGGMRAKPAVEMWSDINPTPRSAKIPDPTTLVTFVKRDGSRQSIPVRDHEVDTLVASNQFEFGTPGAEGGVTLVERQPSSLLSPSEELAVAREKRAQKQEREDALRRITEDEYGAIAGNARTTNTGEIIPGTYRLGKQFNVGAYGQVGEQMYRDMAGGLREATVDQGRMPTVALADSVRQATMGRYSQDAIPAAEEILRSNMEGFKFDPATGKYVKPEDTWLFPSNPVTRFLNPGGDETRLWTDFLSTVGKDILKDGVTEQEWRTTRAWLEANGATPEQLNLSAKAANASGIPDPALVGQNAAMPAERKQVKGKWYVRKSDGWYEE